nr:hypothetical protein MIMGU_mgv1a017372mg [Ipomoea batatas]
MITLSPGSVSTMSEAPLAASVASATAIPISAFFKAGASFTPSPVIPTIKHPNHGSINSILIFNPREALAAKRRTWSFSTPFANTSTKFLSTLSLLRVKVPVLSLHSHIHACHFFKWQSFLLGDGALLEQLVGSNSHCDRQNSGHGNRDATDQEHEQIVNSIPVLPVLKLAMEHIQKVPMAVRTFWKCPDLVRAVYKMSCPSQRKCGPPVAITTASISPCLQVEPEKTSSPGCLVTGRDSPVRADLINLLKDRLREDEHLQG